MPDPTLDTTKKPLSEPDPAAASPVAVASAANSRTGTSGRPEAPPFIPPADASFASSPAGGPFSDAPVSDASAGAGSVAVWLVAVSAGASGSLGAHSVAGLDGTGGT